MKKTRSFRVAQGVVTLPIATLPDAGATNLRLSPGDVFTLDAERVDRFVRRSLASGDLIEVVSAGALHGDVARVPPPAAPSAPAPTPEPTPEIETAPVRIRKEK